MKINIEPEVVVDLLMDRLEYWIKDSTEETKTVYRKLFRKMYEAYYGDYDGDYGEFDPGIIVDNDYINYCRVVFSDEEEYEKIEQNYEEGEYKWECGAHYERIEAKTLDSDGERVFLIRTIL